MRRIRRAVAIGLLGGALLTGGLAFSSAAALAAVPLTSTGEASAISRTGATLEGVVNPEGEPVTSCEFEYGTSMAYGDTTACAPAPGSGSSPATVSGEVTGLTLGTTYHYRLVAGNSQGLEPGADLTFTTKGAVFGLQTEAATDIEQRGFGSASDVATLTGSLEPNGMDTHYYFEYGETEAYGSVSPVPPGIDAGAAFQLEHAQTTISGLRPAAVYHFRLVGANSLGSTDGSDATFVTPTQRFEPPAIGSSPASGVTQSAATLNGTLQTGGALVDYHFEYGTSTAYGSIAPIPDGYAPITDETVGVSQPVGDLQAGTVYHYRIVASSPGATEVKGPDETFTTLAVPAPSVSTGGASGVGVGAATLSGTVDPHGWDTSYSFQYGTSTAYGSSWPTVLVDMGALEGSQPVEVGVPNLLPDTTYHYRLVAANAGGIAYGPDMTFTTGEYPPQVIQEPSSLGTLLIPSGKVAKSTPKKHTKQRKHRKKASHRTRRSPPRRRVSSRPRGQRRSEK